MSADTWYDGEGKPFQPQVHYFVGGATKLYGAALYRLRAEDFNELRHCDGISPAWPIGYDEMEPYYTEAERIYRVHGARGEDPTEGPSSAPYPFPAVSHEPRIQQLADDLEAAGHHPFHAPCGVMLDERDTPNSTCVRCATCDGFPCLVHAKSDADVLAVRPALKHPNVTLLTGSEVVRLETDDRGRAVTGVVVDRAGERETYTADLVVVSCGAANSAKLLLASANDAHPHGLANGSDQVGRNYMFHNCTGGAGALEGAEPDRVPEDARAQRLLLQRARRRLSAGQHPDGRQVERRDVPRREAAADEARTAVDARQGGRARGRLLALDGGPAGAGQPRDRARRRQSRSSPIPPTNDKAKERLLHELKQLLKHVGMHEDHLVPRHAYLKNDIPVAGCAHQAGTCRFGTDPASSVLDVDCRAHEVDNLYVVDTSFFPSIGAVNPALTAMANAVRVGDRILERLGAPQTEREPAHVS